MCGATITRWIHVGVKVPGSGVVVKLEAVPVGGRMMTSKPALIRFITAQTRNVAGPVAEGDLRQPSKRSKAAASAGRELEAMGC